MTINGFALACAIDESPPYFTYSDQTMLIIQSKNHAKSKIDDFQYIEPFIEALISHESIFVVTLYHLSLCLNTCTEAFLLLAEPYPPILSLNLDLSLSTWYCAIMRLPTIFSSSRSLSSSMFGA